MKTPSLAAAFDQFMPLKQSPDLHLTTAASRNITIDLARVLAAYGVIAIHTPTATKAAAGFTAVFWSWCVPFFYATSLTLFLGSISTTSTQAVFRKAWQRVVVPYLAWTVIYTGLLATKNWLVHGERTFNWWRILLYGESAVQLYFLPTLLLMQALAFACYLLFTPDRSRRATGWLLLAGAGIYMTWGIYKHCFGLPSPSNILGIIAFLIAAFALAPIMRDPQRRPRFVVVGGLLLGLAIVCSYLNHLLMVLGYPLILPMGGIGALLLALGLSTASIPRWVVTLAALSFGVYLSHVLFIEAFEFLLARFYHQELVYGLKTKVCEVSLIFVAASCLVLVLKRIPFFRRVLLGER